MIKLIIPVISFIITGCTSNPNRYQDYQGSDFATIKPHFITIKSIDGKDIPYITLKETLKISPGKHKINLIGQIKHKKIDSFEEIFTFEANKNYLLDIKSGKGTSVVIKLIDKKSKKTVQQFRKDSSYIGINKPVIYQNPLLIH